MSVIRDEDELITTQPANSFCAVPQLLNLQGRLTDKQGMPLNGDYSVKFSLWSTSTGTAGGSAWGETQNVKAERGVFGVLLGSVNPIPADVFTGADFRYLEIDIESPVNDPPMTPRQRLVTVAYAFLAEEANHAKQADSATSVPDNSITTPKIADGAVIPQKLSTDALYTDQKAVKAVDDSGKFLKVSTEPATLGQLILPSTSPVISASSPDGKITLTNDTDIKGTLKIGEGTVTIGQTSENTQEILFEDLSGFITSRDNNLTIRTTELNNPDPNSHNIIVDPNSGGNNIGTIQLNGLTRVNSDFSVSNVFRCNPFWGNTFIGTGNPINPKWPRVFVKGSIKIPMSEVIAFEDVNPQFWNIGVSTSSKELSAAKLCKDVALVTKIFDSDTQGIMLLNSVNNKSLFEINGGGRTYFAGNIGIGTANPTQKLDISHGNIRAVDGGVIATSFTLTGLTQDPATADGTLIYRSDTGQLRFRTGNNWVAVTGAGVDADLLDGLDSTYFLNVSGSTQTKTGGLNIGGNVGIGNKLGIGTTNPTQKLDISHGNIRALDGGVIATSFTLTGLLQDPVTADGTLVYRSDTGQLRFRTGNNWVAVSTGTVKAAETIDISGSTQTKTGGLNIGGNFGLGTSTPKRKLDLYINKPGNGNRTSNNFIRFTRESLNNEVYGGIEFANTASPGEVKFGLLSGTNIFGLEFLTPKGISMVINEAGNVGIGTLNPSGKFQVIGQGTFTVLDNGNVGIGTANPTQKLEISNGNIRAVDGGVIATSFTLTGLSQDPATADGTLIYRSDTGQLRLRTGNNWVAVSTITIPGAAIDISGSTQTKAGGLNIGGNVGIGNKLGIGTTNPTQKLDISHGNIRALDGGVIATSFTLTGLTQDPATADGTLIYRSDTGQLRLRTGNNWVAVSTITIPGGAINISGSTQTKTGGLNIGGSVGIGTTNPLSALHIRRDASDATSCVVKLENRAAGGETKVNFYDENGTEAGAMFMGSMNGKSLGLWTESGRNISLIPGSGNVSVTGKIMTTGSISNYGVPQYPEGMSTYVMNTQYWYPLNNDSTQIMYAGLPENTINIRGTAQIGKNLVVDKTLFVTGNDDPVGKGIHIRLVPQASLKRAYIGLTGSISTDPNSGEGIYFYDGTNGPINIWARAFRGATSTITVISASNETLLNIVNYEVSKPVLTEEQKKLGLPADIEKYSKNISDVSIASGILMLRVYEKITLLEQENADLKKRISLLESR